MFGSTNIVNCYLNVYLVNLDDDEITKAYEKGRWWSVTGYSHLSAYNENLVGFIIH